LHELLRKNLTALSVMPTRPNVAHEMGAGFLLIGYQPHRLLYCLILERKFMYKPDNALTR